MESVVTRIAPSPTGPLHLGTARSALFNFLFARKHRGKFILRIEDTDRARSTKEFEENILAGLSWLGITYDALFRQSERINVYQSALETLLASDAAYMSREQSRDDPQQETEVIRLRNPGERVAFDDMVRGSVTFDTAELGDFVIARSLKDPLYHLAVVVDDAQMGITHVIRGEDHISNTPRQILIQRALGYTAPHYAHIPLILTPDRTKLSKRYDATAISEFQAHGYLPEAIVNYLALLGWNPGGEQELFSMEELVSLFSIEQIQKGGASFDVGKLQWFNREYLKRLGQDALFKIALPYIPQRLTTRPIYNEDTLRRALPVIIERVQILGDIKAMGERGELDYYFSQPKYNPPELIWKNVDASETTSHILKLVELLEPITNFTAKEVREAVWGYAEEEGRGAVLWPMRFALSGKKQSPDPFSLAEIIGKKETLERLHHAIVELQKQFS